MSLDEFRKLFDELWIENAVPCKVKMSIKESFLTWISDCSGLNFNQINQRLGIVFEELFGEIESEYANVQPEYLDPKYIHHFLITP
jgi:hypothetical protein